MELNPGESVNVVLEGEVDTPRVINERMLCHAIIGRSGGKELVMRVAINCEFIAPLLEFSTDKVSFRVDKVRPFSCHCVFSDMPILGQFWPSLASVSIINGYCSVQSK